MKVFIRVRPKLRNEKQDQYNYHEVVDKNIIMIKEEDKTKKNIKTSSFIFDRIFEDAS